jgi:hypothetical protein
MLEIPDAKPLYQWMQIIPIEMLPGDLTLHQGALEVKTSTFR